MKRLIEEAGIAHEINNPLAIMSGYLSLIPRYLNQGEKILEITGQLQKACRNRDPKRFSEHLF